MTRLASSRMRYRLALVAALAGLLAACVTVNITFPQEKLEGAAGQIEDIVRSPENPKPPAQPKKEPQSRLSERLYAAVGPVEAAAQTEIDLRITPEFRKLIEKEVASRRARRPQIDQWKAHGCIGENSQGLLEARPGQGCSGEVNGLVADENSDRQSIHAKFMQHYKVPSSDLPRVRAAFAKGRRDRAQAGEWIQPDNGQWIKK